ACGQAAQVKPLAYNALRRFSRMTYRAVFETRRGAVQTGAGMGPSDGASCASAGASIVSGSSISSRKARSRQQGQGSGTQNMVDRYRQRVITLPRLPEA